MLELTPVEDIEKIHNDLRDGFNSGRLKSIPYRKYQLLQLAYLVQDNVKRFEDALKTDLGRPPLESHFLEINGTIDECKTAYSGVDKWAKQERPSFSFNYVAMRPVIRKEPKGVVLIISPFNYPLWLSVGPLAGAIAAGNTVVVKPSEKSAAVSALLAELAPKYLDTSIVRIVNGSIPETTRLLELKWDHILYTGGSRVGRIVAEAAAKHLTPVSLELGGKSPVIIDPRCDLETASKRLLWGKLVNAGQTCVAPDYVLVPSDFQDTLVKALKETYDKFYPKESPPEGEATFSRLICPDAFNRVSGLLKNTKGTVVVGGNTDESKKYIAPTIVKDVKGDDSLMSEEIFGPVLPIVPVKDVDDAIAFVNAHDHPLALYVFSSDTAFKNKVFDSTLSGACVANETLIHAGADGMPFGGVGSSGYGYHTGKFTFDMFTHLRASLDSPSWIDRILAVRFPPYTAKNLTSVTNFLAPSLPARPTGPPRTASTSRWGRWLLFWIVLAFSGLLKSVLVFR